MSTRLWLAGHERDLARGMHALESDASLLDAWGAALAERFEAGGRLLAAGNGGSAAEAQHLTAELVGRYRTERRPLSAICLSAETSSMTAIVNDYGPDELFARQVEAHGRPGDVLVLLSTSGASRNVILAAERGRRAGLAVWGLTGPTPNPLALRCHATVAVPVPATAVVQAVHLVAVHALCAALDRELARQTAVPA